MVTTVIAGHSHIAALGIPQKNKTAVTELVPLAGKTQFAGLTGQWPRSSDYWSELVRLSTDHHIVVSWRGNQYLSEFMFALTPKIDFVLSAKPQLPVDPECVVIPELAVREIFWPSLVELQNLLIRLNKVKRHRIIVAGSPPPKDDDDFCRKYLQREPGFGRTAESLGLDLQTAAFTAPLIRYKFWAVLKQLTADLAAAHNADFLTIPASAQAASGFLARQYWAEDATHANREYGQLVLQDLESVLAKGSIA